MRVMDREHRKKKKSKVSGLARKALLADRMHGAGKADLTRKEPASMDTGGSANKLYKTT